MSQVHNSKNCSNTFVVNDCFCNISSNKRLITGELEYPNEDSTAGSMIVTDGFGNLIFATPLIGPGVSTDNAIARWNGITGNTIQDSLVIISDTGLLTTPSLISSGLSYPTADGLANQVLSTDGFGNLSFTTVVVGPGVSTDNAIARYDGVGGNIQDSLVIISDTGLLTTPSLISSGLSYPTVDGTINQVLSTDGAGNLSFIDTVSSSTLSTDNAIARYDGVTGNIIQNSLATISDTGLLNITSIIATTSLVAASLSYPTSDGTINQVLSTDGAGNLSFIDTVSSSTLSTNNAIARYDGVTGNIIQNSLATISDTGLLNIPSLVASGLSYPLVDGTATQVIQTDGAGNLSFTDNAVVGPPGPPGPAGPAINLVTSIPSYTYQSVGLYISSDNNRPLSVGPSPLFGPGNNTTFLTDIRFHDNPDPPTGNIKQISIMLETCTILTTTGEVWTRGRNDHGELGIGTFVDNTFNKSNFQKVTSLPSISWIIQNRSQGFTTTFAFTAAGAMYGWGSNTAGALGQGDLVDRNTPVLITVPGSGIVNMYGGIANASACGSDCWVAVIDSLGGLHTWGENADGQLGQGDTIDRPSPTTVIGITCQLNKLSVMTAGTNGKGFTRIIQSDNSTWASGENTEGSLGDGTFVNKTSFVADAAGDTDVDRLFEYTDGMSGWISTSDQLRLVGRNAAGGLGDTTLVNKNTRVVPVFTGQDDVLKCILWINTDESSYVLTNSGDVYFAGLDTDGNSGIGLSGANYTEFQHVIMPRNSSVDDIVVSGTTETTVYYLTSDQRLFASGGNAGSQLGAPVLTNSVYPVRVFVA